MDKLKIKIINKSHHPLPDYGTHGAAGMDVRAYLPEGSVTLRPFRRPRGCRSQEGDDDFC